MLNMLTRWPGVDMYALELGWRKRLSEQSRSPEGAANKVSI